MQFLSPQLEGLAENCPSKLLERRGGLMVSVLDTGLSGLGLGPGLGHCVVFLGKTLYSHGASLHPGVYSYFEKGCRKKCTRQS